MELLRTRKPLFGKRNAASPSEPAGDSPENDPRQPDVGNLGWYRPHNESLPPRLAHTSCARRPPKDQKHNGDRYWRGSVMPPSLAEYLSSFPTIALPPLLQR